MLTQVRGALKGAVAWFVIVLLILAFALWGVPELRQFSGSSAITVGKERFSHQYVLREFNRAVQNQRIESDGEYTREAAIASGLDDKVVSQITTVSALDQFSKAMRLAMPRELVAEYLRDNENFKDPATGKFDRNVLTSILQQNGMTVDEFERRVAGDLMRGQLIEALATRAPAPTSMVDALLTRETEQRRIRYLVVTDEMAGRAQEPTPEELKSYYDANAAAFTAPEYRTFDLLVLRNEDFRKDAQAPEEELRRIYELNKERLYDKPERRTLYQITLETEAEAQAAVAELRQGKPFENIALENGRSLEAVTFTEAIKRDILNPAVAEAAFDAEAGEGAILDPVQSLLGWTVVQIAAIIPAEPSTFEEKRDEIETQYLEQDVQRARNDAIDEIEDVRDTGAELAAAAETLGFEVRTVGPVDRYSFAPGGAILADIPGEALAEAFVLDEGEESEAMELAEHDGYFFVSLREVEPPALRPFEDVRDNVDARWRKDERERRISAFVRGIRETAEGGEDLAAAAAPFDRTPTELVIDRRFSNEAISPIVNEEIFAAAPKEIVSGPAAFGEAQIIVEILDVGSTRGRIPPDQVDLYKQYLGFQLDQELIDAFLAAVREDSKVKINQAQLDTIFSEES